MGGGTRARCGAVAALFLFAIRPLGTQGDKPPETCEAPEYYGICDPYVPGVVVGGRDRAPVPVLSTWPGGPAERAGICAGDRIVAANDLTASQNSWEGMIREIVSSTPGSVRLVVRRGNREFQVNIDRERESTLAMLTKQKYFKANTLSGNQAALILVPVDETRREVAQVEAFRGRIDSRYSVKWVGPFPVPQGTPKENEGTLRELYSGGLVARRVGTTSVSRSPTAWWAGFDAAVLERPDAALVYHILPGSPAWREGVLPGDELLQVNGRTVSGMDARALGEMLYATQEKRPVVIAVRRGGLVVQLAVHEEQVEKLQTLDPYTELPLRARPLGPDDYTLGIGVLGADNPREAIISSVHYPSAGFDAGLHVGDRVLSVNGVSIEAIGREHLNGLLTPNSPAETVLRILRLGRRLIFRVRPTTDRQALAKIGRKPAGNGSVPQGCPPLGDNHS